MRWHPKNVLIALPVVIAACGDTEVVKPTADGGETPTVVNGAEDRGDAFSGVVIVGGDCSGTLVSSGRVVTAGRVTGCGATEIVTESFT